MSISKSLVIGTALISGAFTAITMAQAPTAYTPPKTSWGVPDLQGTYNIATVTMLERGPQFNGKLIITEEEAAQIGATGESYLNDLTTPTDGEPDVGGYNTFWMDPGERMAEINGEIRTSIIVNPESGTLPWDRAAQRAMFASRRSGETGPYDGPEARPLGERCLVGFGSSGGPPMLPVLYNNHSQIVQTPDYVMILAEMNHDARIIRIGDSEHIDRQKWLGDSIGHYEGDTLVVETTNFNSAQSFRGSLRHFIYISPDATVTERFTRLSDNKLLYRFTVDDPKIYTQPWTGELPMNAVDDKVYEYACHEGNYALPGILAGARKDESEGRTPGQ